ncbi:nuclear receptor binding SET domain protein-like isoform X1 [Anopheles bellator]|uniref:nuclear receptor binding SET domain protein-like isoform X1 n=1 Tax=Anopheles bellator TaxID=139047 RepID=UPI002649634F|nr:nuclear receptor binding SET domain protein-like isoform X1 [Anopheles bellator]
MQQVSQNISSCEGETTLIDYESRKANKSAEIIVRSKQERSMLKQLQTSLSPKMTEIVVNRDQRVSRYGRHQKQKENLNCLPVDVAKFVPSTHCRSPAKYKPKPKADPSHVVPDNWPQKVEVKEEPLELPVDNDKLLQSDGLKMEMDVAIPMMQESSEELLAMDEINIIGMDISFNNDSSKKSTLASPLHADCLASVFHRSYDADSAKGSSINFDDIRVADICWGTQSKNQLHWPCIIRSDPDSGLTTRKSIVKEHSMEVHVSFFGDNGRRAWLKETLIIPFDGMDNYCTRVNNLDFGKAVRTKMKLAMRGKAVWKTACEIAESYCRLPFDARLEKFEENLKQQQSSRKRLKKATKNDGAIDFSDTIKRSESSESLTYENIYSVTDIGKQNYKSRPAHSSTLYENTIDRFFRSLDHNVSNDESVVADKFDLHEYVVLMKFIRLFLFNGRTDPTMEEKLQTYVKQICCLKKKTNGTERTVALKRNKSLWKALHAFGINLAEENAETESYSASKRQSRPRKEDQSLEEKFIFCLDRNYLTNGLPKGYVCNICQQPNDVVKCSKCNQHVHINCITTDDLARESMNIKIEQKCFLCPECIHHADNDDVSWRKCFICSDEQSEVEGKLKYRCIANSCTQVYHLNCLSLFPQYREMDQQTIICPYHVCHTCVSDDPKGKSSNTKLALVRCTQCPSAYHSDERCIPAGSQFITNKQIVCPKHSLLERATNVNWCFLCCKTGDDILVLCDTCPIAVHRGCLNELLPEGKYICDMCKYGRFPLYNEIVLVKMGKFRWWPALTLPPPAVPENLKQMLHEPGDICVKFFFTHDMAWINRRSMYLYDNGDSENLGAQKSGTLNQRYHKAMQEARTIFNVLETRKTKNPLEDTRPPSFFKIKANRYIAPLKQSYRRSLQSKEILDSVCNCCVDDDDPCGIGSSCINRATLVECNPKTCSAKNRCMNQCFAKRDYPALEVRRFADRGHGLVTKTNLIQGQFVIEYVGEVINKQEFQRRLNQMEERKEQNFYFLELDAEIFIDAGPKGNLARFINHSCEPNCEIQKWNVGNTRVIGIFALKDINTNDELTFDYCWEKFGEKQPCLCGAKKCSGIIGEKYRILKAELPSLTNANTNTKTKGLLSRKRRLQTKPRAGKKIKTEDSEDTLMPPPL